VLGLSSCGVITDSSKNLQSSGGNAGTGTGSTPIDTNSSNTGGGSSGNNGGSSNGTTPMFDTSGGAEYDANACKSAYATAVPLQDSANTARETDDNANGISIMSLYRQTLVPADSNVIAFYKTIPSGTVLQDVTKRKNIYGDNSQFVIMYDPAWETIQNNTIYVQTPKLSNTLNSCFRVTIDSNNSISLVPKKVYSYKQ